MSIYWWGLLAGVIAVCCEALFKQYSYSQIYWIAIPASIVINYAVYNMVQLAHSLPSAFIVFGFTTMLCRLVLSLWLGHVMTTLTWIAVLLYLIALILREVERRVLLQ